MVEKWRYGFSRYTTWRVGDRTVAGPVRIAGEIFLSSGDGIFKLSNMNINLRLKCKMNSLIIIGLIK